MRIFRKVVHIVPIHVNVVVLHEMHAEVEPDILQIDLNGETRAVESPPGLGNAEFPVLESKPANVLGRKGHIVSDLYTFLGSVESDGSLLRVLVRSVLNEHPQSTNPSHLLPLLVSYEKSVHLDQVVADKVKEEPLFPLHGVAELLFGGRQLYAEMRVPS